MTVVVITRKHKKIHKGLHALAAVLTGGASLPVTAAKAVTNTMYNIETDRLAASKSHGRRDRVVLTPEEKAYMAAHVPQSARRRK